MTFRIAFVCLGNICRSPMAEIALRSMLVDVGLSEHVEVSSAGTGDWHVGEGADPRTVDVLRRHGYGAAGHRARQFTTNMFDDNDLVIAMDRSNVAALNRLAPDRAAEVRLLRSFDPDADDTDVPDPYYGGPSGFDDALAMVEAACHGIVEWLRAEGLARS